MPAIVDINADLGEGLADDEKFLPYISSVNIACGAHAGDHETMVTLVCAAKQAGTAIGAHPSYPDRENFGRKELQMEPAALYDTLLSQINLLAACCTAEGATLRHVKPHGALYNHAARDPLIAAVLADAVAAIDPTLLLFGLAGSKMLDIAAGRGLQVVSEAFADRTYNGDGSLVNRTLDGAVITNSAQAVAQCLDMIRKGSVNTIMGETIPIQADTICLHGDHPDALAFARIINAALKREGIFIQSPAVKK
ncbi:5-oxoprolinase subunit PxpA [Flavihumibacter petaseus]|uniref:5-oxoprolinase subunit A n=1 Tax=Flavihumibacter petaseus NBRC 106054 TaxID=1220578 RepID=A0A0E9MXL1_9BACT|nr:5-oxoprolinase subunit PxpA [Flavihumibacter petaseus]GAO42243.1 hypothetical protein FPE01S_01_12560 [Flavihumibacter petaseus NBRC 106054]